MVGWLSLTMGSSTGLLLGLWSFDGPVPVPAWLGDYDDTSRRLARLGHIALVALVDRRRQRQYMEIAKRRL